MNAGRKVFSQLIEFLFHQELQKCVGRYADDRYLKNLSCWDQYLAMAFAQLTYRESLRDIKACRRSVGGKRYREQQPYPKEPTLVISLLSGGAI
jgi:hypothetical protein